MNGVEIQISTFIVVWVGPRVCMIQTCQRKLSGYTPDCDRLEIL